ncbi:MAG: glutamine--fructose-6-phosphate transaminase (isomerizing) [Chiayiivirga sp.]|jgi:glucosamine--fructose-6-phosphate aminotransferase (isomerizing)|uniref:glutamine--fructose-6-phosphate transaminase (isomerizing) n=1 Tax=Chiayiivirga sp. TaxID=2041042 RepID=UPI0025BAEEC8|nr:glutamine--fructose-6-phosphate transaminase (isomerizing) [Chiayiivirga sp.]MCI1711612.1 glutamine--fructose-6-phosphate transaminase (isomerizing) [Chiayiivirga sp.]MCI1730635.1 glutamine--fructose-6-phosphate transaminase (isomerizing) [Chiayiivirga sp.]
MCGIVGISAQRDVVEHLISGLKALEYRGYDSAGIAVLTATGLDRRRAKGKVRDLEALQNQSPLSGHSGIAHTRWATHGVPNTRNAHPHISGDSLSVVHNGIIENHEALRAELRGLGYEFNSDTDTEVIAHLVEHHQRGGASLLDAARAALARMHGAYAVVLISGREPGVLVGARRGSPLVVGLGEGENYLASDIHALLPLTRRFIYLAEGDVAEIRCDSLRVFDEHGAAVTRPVKESHFSADAVERGEYRHYMLKEIHEQPRSIADTLEGRIAAGRVLPEVFGVGAAELLAKAEAVHVIACGTSFHAGLVARYWIESLAGLPCTTEIASEYRYRSPVVRDGTLFVTISQSGETADTLAALKLAQQRNYLARLVVCNVPESSLVRESDLVLMTRAGPEIGVASTKAFTTQLTALALLALQLASTRGLSREREHALVSELESIPGLVTEALKLDPQIKALAEQFVPRSHALFLGRGTHYPVALEGALKLKEISYIHAEAYPAGELKHGPLALVDENMPVVAVAPNDHLLDKLKSNMEEVRARGGVLYLFADTTVSHGMGAGHVLSLPPSGEIAAPIVFTLPLQLLAYHVAVLRGTDVDQPRNLAKSVTVE